jgi:hypothetical protein
MPFSIWQPIEPNFFGYGNDDELASLPRRKVWEGTVDFPSNVEMQSANHQVLEALFDEFNLRHPAGFRGHSLSVNDVVCLGENSFRVAPIGWKLQAAPSEVPV